MNLNKNKITKQIVKDTSISYKNSSNILDFFLGIVIEQSKKKSVKLTGFGTFCIKITPKRIGRDPKSKKSYIIPKLHKLNFKPSNTTKLKIN
jgi:nucleoid DNA-binding protein